MPKFKTKVVQIKPSPEVCKTVQFTGSVTIGSRRSDVIRGRLLQSRHRSLQRALGNQKQGQLFIYIALASGISLTDGASQGKVR